jgi:hypothetical protein
MHVKTSNVVLALVFGALAALAPPAAADEQQCRGQLGAVTVDNLQVPAGAACMLDGTQIQGSLKVETGAALDAKAIRVIGNVQAENANSVIVTGSQVGGSFQIKQGGSASLGASTVAGDVQLDSNSGLLNVSSNRVGGSVQVFQNTGGASIADNSIDGNLQCKENAPPPMGGGNVVQGNAEDQCAALAEGTAVRAAGFPASSTSTGSSADAGPAATPSVTSNHVRMMPALRAKKTNRPRCKRPRRRAGARRRAPCRRKFVRVERGRRERAR